MAKRSTVIDLPGFDEWWAVYPRKVKKKDARKAWAEVDPSEDLRAKMMATLAWQRVSPDWLKQGGAFIPYPASWIRAERWDDEPTEIPNLNDRSARLLRRRHADDPTTH